jgi:tungstate transport system permease protein
MEFIFDSLKEAFILIWSLDREFLHICWTSCWITGAATTLGVIFSLPIASLIALNQFKGKYTLIIILNTLMSIPTVVIGLSIYSILCRKGIFGNLAILYTPYAMIIGQFILISPIITALITSTLEEADERIEKTARALGATKWQTVLVLLSELRIVVLAAIITGFSRAFSEIGVSMILGGNIKNYTRNIPTAIAFEITKGEFSLAVALGILLLFIAFTINLSSQLIVRIRR